jgi:hypothetical protein
VLVKFQVNTQNYAAVFAISILLRYLVDVSPSQGDAYYVKLLVCVISSAILKSDTPVKQGHYGVVPFNIPLYAQLHWHKITEGQCLCSNIEGEFEVLFHSITYD